MDNISEYNKFSDKTVNKSKQFIIEEKLSQRIKKMINKIFSENIFYIDKANQEFNISDLSFKEIDILNEINQAKEVLGDEICKELLKSPSEARCFIELLSSYVKWFKVLDDINERLLPARIKPLILAYKEEQWCLHRYIDYGSMDSLLELFKNKSIVYVKELPKLLSVSIDIKMELQIIDFIKWLSDDKVLIIQNKFKQIFKTERDENIIKIRATGATLDTVGKEYGITRERVRQLERKVLAKFENFVSRIRPNNILQAFTQSDTVLTIEQIKNYLGELSSLYIYCLKKGNSKKALWSEKLKSFIIGDRKWYEKLSEYIDRLPDRFEVSDLELHISNALVIYDTHIDHDMALEFILTDYKLMGNFYSKKEIKKTDVYLAVLERYYPHGIKLFDDFELMRFRNYANDLFGDIKISENNRALCARIADITVLCNRGKYILPSRIRFDGETLDKIYQFIVGSKRNVIMFGELFERFKAELLEKTSIDNHFYLQGVLKYKYANNFFFTKDTLIKDINSEQEIKLSIAEFIKEQGRIVIKEEVREEFLGITEAVLFAAIVNNPNVLLWDFGKYLHAEQLVVDDAMKGRLKKLIDYYTAQGPISVQKIYRDIYTLENNFLITNNIEGYIALYSVFNFLFPDDYEFSRPYISSKGSKATTFNTVIREYLSSFDEVYISDFKDYIESIKTGNFTVSVLLDDISDEFIRVDSDLLFKKDRLNLSKDIIESIEETTLALIGSTGYLVVKKMLDYMFYPDIGVKWTPFLLVSVVKYFCKRVKIINIATGYRYLNEIIVDSSLNINDYDELLHYVLKQKIKYTSFKNVDEIKRFLLDQGLIVKNIPSSLFDKGYITEEEYGGIKIG